MPGTSSAATSAQTGRGLPLPEAHVAVMHPRRAAGQHVPCLGLAKRTAPGGGWQRPAWGGTAAKSGGRWESPPCKAPGTGRQERVPRACRKYQAALAAARAALPGALHGALALQRGGAGANIGGVHQQFFAKHTIAIRLAGRKALPQRSPAPPVKNRSTRLRSTGWVRFAIDSAIAVSVPLPALDDMRMGRRPVPLPAVRLPSVSASLLPQGFQQEGKIHAVFQRFGLRAFGHAALLAS